MADKLKFEIIEELIVLSENAKGWRKELNRVSWNDAEPKYDIRTWSPDHEKMGKGITLSEEEFGVLLKELEINKSPEISGLFNFLMLGLKRVEKFKDFAIGI